MANQSNDHLSRLLPCKYLKTNDALNSISKYLTEKEKEEIVITNRFF